MGVPPASRQQPFGLGIALSSELSGTCPVSSGLSAAGLRFLRHPSPTRELSSPYGLLTATSRLKSQTLLGLPRSTLMRGDGGEVSSIRRGRGVRIRPRSADRRPVTCIAVTAISAICVYDASDEDSLSFTCPIFPLPGYTGWLSASLGVTLRFTPCCYQQRMGVLGTALDSGLESF